MKAVILVAGRGKRMGYELPKPLLKKRGKTLLDYIIKHLKSQGVNEVILKVGDRKEFNRYPCKKFRSLKDAVKNLKDDFLLLVGDSIIKFDLKRLQRVHKKNKSKLTVLTKDYVVPYGTVNKGKWIEKPVIKTAVGVFIVNPSIVKSNSIPEMCNRKFSTLDFLDSFVHLTTKEDYLNWKDGR